MAEAFTRAEIKDRLAELVRSAAPGETATFELYWDLLNPHLEEVLEQGAKLTRGPQGWQVGQAKLFGSKEGDLVGNLVLASLGAWGEAQKAGVSDRESISRIVSGYTVLSKEIAMAQRGIEDFVVHMVSEQVPSDTETKSAKGLPYICWKNEQGWRIGHAIDAEEKDRTEIEEYAILVDTRLHPSVWCSGHPVQHRVGLGDVSLAWLCAFIICIARGAERTNTAAVRDVFGKITNQDAEDRAVASELARVRRLLGDIDRELIVNDGKNSWIVPEGSKVCLVVGPESPYLNGFLKIFHARS